MIERLENRVLLSAVPALASTYSGMESGGPNMTGLFDTVTMKQHGRQLRAHAWGVPAAGDFAGRDSALSGSIKPNGAVTLSGRIRYWTPAGNGSNKAVMIGRIVIHGVDANGVITGTYTAFVARKWEGVLAEDTPLPVQNGTLTLTPA